MIPADLVTAGLPEPVADSNEERSQVGTDDFLQMLIAQLENQDPLDPQDPTEFTAQLATFSNLEQLVSIRGGVEDLVDLQSEDGEDGPTALESLLFSLTTTSMIGKEVMAAGNFFELGESGEDATLRFNAGLKPGSVEINVRDAAGSIVKTVSSLDDTEEGQSLRNSLQQGLNEWVWDGTTNGSNNAAAGVYSFEITAERLQQPLEVQEFVEGRVTGTTLESDQPTLFMGEVAIPLSNVIEIREATP